MEGLTEEQKTDIADREKQFIEKYEGLVHEFQMDFQQFPSYVPMGSGLFATQMQAVLRDKKYLPVASPIQQ